MSAECRKCGKPIIWATMVKTGKANPVDPEPDEHGNVILFRRDGKVMGKTRLRGEPLLPGERLRTSHFQTCEHAQSFRR